MWANVSKKVYGKVGVTIGDNLPNYALPDGAPVYYLDADGFQLCGNCASALSTDLESAKIVDVFILDMGDELTCEECAETFTAELNGFIKAPTVDHKWIAPQNASGLASAPSWLPVVYPHGAVSI